MSYNSNKFKQSIHKTLFLMQAQIIKNNIIIKQNNKFKNMDQSKEAMMTTDYLSYQNTDKMRKSQSHGIRVTLPFAKDTTFSNSKIENYQQRDHKKLILNPQPTNNFTQSRKTSGDGLVINQNFSAEKLHRTIEESRVQRPQIFATEEKNFAVAQIIRKPIFTTKLVQTHISHPVYINYEPLKIPYSIPYQRIIIKEEKNKQHQKQMLSKLFQENTFLQQNYKKVCSKVSELERERQEVQQIEQIKEKTLITLCETYIQQVYKEEEEKCLLKVNNLILNVKAKVNLLHT